MKSLNKDDDKPIVPTDIANLYTRAGVGESGYHIFAASREEARLKAKMSRELLVNQAAQLEPDVKHGAATADVSRTMVSPEGETSVGSSPGAISPSEEPPPLPQSTRVASEFVAMPQRDAVGSRHRDERLAGQERMSSETPAPVRQPRFRDGEGDAGGLASSAMRPVMGEHSARPPMLIERSGRTPRFLRDDQRTTIPAAVSETGRRREIAAPQWAAPGSARTEDRRPSCALSIQAPVIALFSLEHGVGTTTLAAMLGRMLARQGERVLLMDAHTHLPSPILFAIDGVAPATSRVSTQAVTRGGLEILHIDGRSQDLQGRWPVSDECRRKMSEAQRIVVDMQAGCIDLSQRLFHGSAMILVPLQPTMASVAKLQSTDAFLRRQNTVRSSYAPPLYIMNRFDSSMPLHRDVQQILTRILGDRLLPCVIRHVDQTRSMLAQDVASAHDDPTLQLEQDVSALASWVRNLAPLRTTTTDALLRRRER